MWGPVIMDEEASSVFEESPSLELLTPGPVLTQFVLFWLGVARNSEIRAQLL